MVSVGATAGSAVGRRRNQFCRVGVDRLIAVVASALQHMPRIQDFDVRRDSFRRAGSTRYRRVRDMENATTGTSLRIEYQPKWPWLSAIKLTITPGNGRYLEREELDIIFSAFLDVRLLQVELAFDFLCGSGVDRVFVLAHAVFGKCKPAPTNSHGTVYFGKRRSGRFVRCYVKPELDAYRVELQFQSSWLRAHKILNPQELCQLTGELCRTCFCFARFDWKQLDLYLKKHSESDAKKVLRQVRRRRHALHRAVKYLRNVTGVRNTHRFLRPLAMNQMVLLGLKAWSRRWGCCDDC